MLHPTHYFRVLCFAACLLSVPFLVAQKKGFPDKNDPLIILTSEAFAMASTHPDSGLTLGFSVLYQARAQKNLEAEAGACNAIAWNYFRKGLADSALPYYLQCLDVSCRFDNPTIISRVNCNIATVLASESRYSEALRYLVDADSFALVSGDYSVQANVKRQTAMLYREQKNNAVAIPLYYEAMELSRKDGDTINYINAGINLGIAYKDIGEYDSSLSVLNHCMGLALLLPHPEHQVTGIHEHLGDTYFHMGNLEQALANQQKAYRSYAGHYNTGDVAYMGIRLGRTFRAMHEYGKAELYLVSSFYLTDSLGMAHYKYEAASELSKLYALTGEWEQAHKYLELSASIKDSLDVSDQLKQTAALQAEYEADKKENEISLLQTRNEKARIIQYFIITAFAALTLFALLIFNRYKIRKKLQEQYMRNKIADHLHDDIGATLSSISLIAEMSSNRTSGQTENEESLTWKKISIQARDMMESMNDIVWSINPRNDELKNLEMRVREYILPLMRSRNIDFTIRTDERIEDLKITMEQRRELYLVIKEAANNLARHSAATSASLYLGKQGNRVLMELTDNGRGFDVMQAMETRGNGLRSMQRRAASIGAEFRVESVPGEGTLVRLLL